MSLSPPPSPLRQVPRVQETPRANRGFLNNNLFNYAVPERHLHAVHDLGGVPEVTLEMFWSIFPKLLPSHVRHNQPWQPIEAETWLSKIEQKLCSSNDPALNAQGWTEFAQPRRNLAQNKWSLTKP